MEIVFARHMGLCWGVKRAIKMAEDAIDRYGRVVATGPLVHNKRVNSNLKERGLVFSDINDVDDGTVVLIRTHSLEAGFYKRLKDKNSIIVDATCPYVRIPINKCSLYSKRGYTVVVAGKKDHPEVRAVVSYAKGRVVVVNDPEELEGFSEKRVALLAQTTLRKDRFDKIKERLSQCCGELVIIDTICDATTLRQKSTEELAQSTDVILIIGDRTSANTNHLFEIAKRFNENAYFVQDADEIDPSWFSDPSIRVGITAGASTPDEMIKECVEKIKFIEHEKWGERFEDFIKNIPDGATYSAISEKGSIKPQKKSIHHKRDTATIDLHGLFVEEALLKLKNKIVSLLGKNVELRIIHGKGIHSPEGRSILQKAVREWLDGEGRSFIRSFRTGRPKEGGDGVTIVVVK